jgi:signal transduction histidine kinase
MRFSCFASVAMLSMLMASPANGQTMAALQRRVSDSSGAALPGASVTARDVATGLTSVAAVNAERYQLPALTPGSYQVTAEARGFRSERIESLTLEVARTLVRDFQLAVDTRREAVVVSAASLRTSYERIRQMAGRLINAQEAARAEIARDLHDDVCQRLASVSMGVGSLKNATLEDPKVQEGISELDRETRDAFESIRRLSHDLHPATLRLPGLAPALRSHCHEVVKRHGGEVQFSSADDIGTVHPDVAVCFFRIAQESLRNSVLHGGAKRMTVTLDREDGELGLTVVDDGQGFDVASVRNNGRGLRLVTMEERLNLVGGHMSIVSVPGQGTTVRVRGSVMGGGGG